MFERLIFGRTTVRRQLPAGPYAQQYAVQALQVPRPGGVVLQGWQARPLVNGGGEKILLYFGGRNEDVCWVPHMASYLDGWTIYAFNYRGMGDSGGVPSERVVQFDILALHAQIRHQHGSAASRFTIMGRSLGTVFAVWLACRVQPDQLVLLSPFRSIGAVLRGRWWTVPLALFARRRFHAAMHVPAISSPALVLLAEHDLRVRQAESLALARSFTRAPEVAVIAGTTHQSLPRSVQTQWRVATYLKEMQGMHR